ncbi:hypothetical protein LSH36_678g01046 [Paralvinella palmiformis]|uniref:Uncharacterized protein n=1 Tax=Paralvinella palmiformis TaxID=53620 RepID=A0AAD9MVL4_9ANNE|nr:hypothetical protein LSH36_678g01046 [Paralvinella palmiformis]
MITIFQEIQVEFEARNMEDSDFHGVRKLLAQLYLKANIDLSELTNTLISQNYIGSVIKDLKCVNEIKSMLLEKCSKCVNKDKLATLLGTEKNAVGVIINERFINIPAQISLPSFQSLWKEVERAKLKKMNYNFSHYVIVSKACRLQVKVQGQNDMRSFLNAEEEYFYQAAEFTCEYSVKGERDSVVSGCWDEDDDEMEPIRVVMVINAKQIDGIMDKLKEVYG